METVIIIKGIIGTNSLGIAAGHTKANISSKITNKNIAGFFNKTFLIFFTSPERKIPADVNPKI